MGEMIGAVILAAFVVLGVWLVESAGLILGGGLWLVLVAVTWGLAHALHQRVSPSGFD